jgi:hypothetical protein
MAIIVNRHDSIHFVLHPALSYRVAS